MPRHASETADLRHVAGGREMRVLNRLDSDVLDSGAAVAAGVEIVRGGELDEHTEVLLCEELPTATDRLGAVRWIQLGQAGFDQARLRAYARRGIVVTTASGVSACAVADYVITVLLLRSQQVLVRLNLQARRAWGSPETARSRRLRDQTVVVLGYGSIGREVGRVAAAHGMRVLAVNRTGARTSRRPCFREGGTGDHDGRWPDAVLAVSDLAEALPAADALVVSVPLSPQTRGMVDTDVLDRLPRGAWLVNVARGRVVDEPALVAALRSGALGGAVLDVFPEEPLPRSSPLWSMSNVVITPHVAGRARGNKYVLRELVLTNVARYLTRERLLNLAAP